MTIQDFLAGNPQTQTFTYDALDRLSSALASGGTGGTYSLQSYSYSTSTGNLDLKAGVSYTYNSPGHAHAVSALSTGQTYQYDANGNQTQRVIGSDTYVLIFDAENRLVEVKKNGSTLAKFTYDGDGNRLKGEITGGATTTYIGSYFEWTGATNTMKKYYYAGATRVAMRTGSSTLNYLLGDHLGSQAITTNSSGVKSAEVRYYPWGTTRYTSGTTPTTFKFTGQRYESGIGLYFYGARFYDPSAGRFISADTVIPGAGNSQAYDRYAYALNNSLRYTDPNGHEYCESRWADPSDCAEAGAVNGHIPIVEIPEEAEEKEPELTWTGNRMNKLYWELYRMSGNKFSLEDFITLILQRELASWWDNDIAYAFFMEAAVRWFYTNWGHSSQNALFNWLGAGMYSAGGILDKDGNNVGVYAQVFDKNMSLQEILADQGQAAERAREVARSIFNPASEWTVYDATAPYSWGSISLIDPNRQRAFNNATIGSTEETGVLFRQDNGFVLTLDQCEYWK